jgi:hypothetical protein
MPKVKMMAGIAAISGQLGNMYFRTDKQTGRVSLCRMPKKSAHPLTEKQRLHHARFAAIAKMVKQMMAEGTKKSRKQLWKIATKAYDDANQ